MAWPPIAIVLLISCGREKAKAKDLGEASKSNWTAKPFLSNKVGLRLDL